MKIRTLAFLLACAAGLLGLLQPTFAQTNEYHGADSVFKMNGIIVVWAIEKRGNEQSPLVYLRIVREAGAALRFRYYSLLAVDPFTKSTRTLVSGQPLAEVNTETAEMADFQIYSSRRILLYANEEEMNAGKPAMVVFYQGVPDTSPEFLEKPKLESYLSDTVRRMETR